MSLFHDQSKRADPHLEWKVRIFSVAAVVGLCGIYFNERWMTGIAIVLLASAMMLRFVVVAPEEEGHEQGSDPSEQGDRPEDHRGE